MKESSSDVTEEAKSLSTTPEPEIDTPSPVQEQISFEFISQCNRDLIPASDRIPSGTNSKFDLLYDQASDLHRKHCRYFHRLFLKERNLNPDSRFTLKNKFITRKEALKYYQAAKRVFNELEKNNIHPERVKLSLEALKQAVKPTPEEEPKECEVIIECVSTTSLTVSDEVKPVRIIPKPEIETPSPMQEQISFELISQCNRDLSAVPAIDLSVKGSRIYQLHDKVIERLSELFSYAYPISLQVPIPSNPLDLTTSKPITRKDALEYYQAAKRVFNELEKNGIHSEPVERSLAALKQAVGVTPAEEPEESEINECTPAISSTVSAEVKPLRAIPEPKINTSSSDIFTFFKKKSINPNIFHAVWPIPISIMATYFVSAIYDASTGAHSLNSVNQFFGSKMKDAASFAEGLKTPGFIYGLATLMTVAFIGIYLYKKNKQVNVEESSLINDQTNNN